MNKEDKQEIIEALERLEFAQKKFEDSMAELKELFGL